MIYRYCAIAQSLRAGNFLPQRPPVFCSVGTVTWDCFCYWWVCMMIHAGDYVKSFRLTSADDDRTNSSASLLHWRAARQR